MPLGDRIRCPVCGYWDSDPKKLEALPSPRCWHLTLAIPPPWPRWVYRVVQGQCHAQGEVRLWAEVLSDALRIVLRPSKQRFTARAPFERRNWVTLLAETEAWIAAPGCRSPGAFESICDLLDIDPAILRKDLVRYRNPPLSTVQEVA